MDRLRKLPVLRRIVELLEVYFGARVARAGAQFAYCLAMSLFPMLIVISAAVSMIPVEDQLLLGQFVALLPDQAQGLVKDYLTYIQSNRSLSLMIGGVIMTLVASSAAAQGLVDIFSEIFGHRIRVGIWEGLFSLALSLLLPLMIYGALLIVLLGDWLLGLVKFLLDVPVLNHGWHLAQWLLPLVITFLVLSTVYWLTGPNHRCGKRIFPGALAGAAALVGATKLFSAFMSVSTRYTVIYGSLASVIILLLWLFLCGNIIILGNVVNFLWTRYNDK